MVKCASLIILIILCSELASASGWFPRRNQSLRQENRPARTEAGFCVDCQETNPSRRTPVTYITSRDNMAYGLGRILTSLYGTCAARTPLTRVSFENYHYKDRVVRTAAEAGQGYVHVPGFFVEGRDLRTIRTASSPLGAYEAVGNDAPRACLDSSYRSTHKSFGMGAAGRMVNGQFQIPTCREGMTPSQKARLCGLTPDSPPGVTLDCAELLGASSVAACLKMHKNQSVGVDGIKLGSYLLSTRSLHNLARDSQSCMNARSNISADSPVVPGDIVVVGTHSVMISAVGTDPFGIARAGGNCSSIDAGDLNFSFGQSSSRQQLGPINSTTQAWVTSFNNYGFGTEYFPLNKFVLVARKMCEDQKRGRSSWTADTAFSGFGMTMLRHKTDEPGCKYGDDCPKVSGDECADACESRG